MNPFLKYKTIANDFLSFVFVKLSGEVLRFSGLLLSVTGYWEDQTRVRVASELNTFH